jgi:ParB family transcriptional regulator, chromosome partitioning protein
VTEKKPVRPALGRGLSALMADVAQAASSASPGPDRQDTSLPIEQLVPNPNQPRRDFGPEAMQDLAASIRTKGVVQPLIVRPIPGGDRFEIVAGERRWRAAQTAGLHRVPVLIRDYSDQEVLEIAIIENIQRADLNPVEEALAYRQLMEKFGHTQEKLATSLSRSRSHIANTLRLLSLPEDVLNMLRAGRLTAGHARAVITAANPAQLALDAVRKGLSVREVERLARKVDLPPDHLARKRGKPQEKDADTRAIEADLSANLRMSVRIDHNGVDEGGKITISYRNLDDLDLICDVLSKIPRDIMGR